MTKSKSVIEKIRAVRQFSVGSLIRHVLHNGFILLETIKKIFDAKLVKFRDLNATDIAKFEEGFLLQKQLLKVILVYLAFRHDVKLS